MKLAVAELKRKEGQELQKPVIQPDQPIIRVKKKGFTTVVCLSSHMLFCILDINILLATIILLSI
jgi:hypothetical protein